MKPPAAPKPLSSKQQRFVEEYLVDATARAAAERAGYNGAVGYRLLRNPAVGRAVAEAQAARSLRLQITADRVLAELAAVAFSDIRRAISWDMSEHSGADPDDPPVRRYAYRCRASHTLDASTAAAIAEFHRYSSGAVRLRMHDKLTALAMLGRHLGVFPALHAPRGPRPDQPEPEPTPAPPYPVSALRELPDDTEPARRLTHEQGQELRGAMTTILRIAPHLLESREEGVAED